MNDQLSLTESSRPSGVVVDETGEFDEHGDHGAVYAGGEYDLERTVDLLAERFDRIADDVPESVSEWTLDGHRYRERVSVKWRRELENGDVETVYVFPRGPWLHEWSIGYDTDYADGGSRYGGAGYGFYSPEHALEAAVSFMRGSL